MVFFVNVDNKQFQKIIFIPTPGRSLEILRGWCSGQVVPNEFQHACLLMGERGFGLSAESDTHMLEFTFYYA